jgi:hypothetical protein
MQALSACKGVRGGGPFPHFAGLLQIKRALGACVEGPLFIAFTIGAVRNARASRTAA